MKISNVLRLTKDQFLQRTLMTRWEEKNKAQVASFFFKEGYLSINLINKMFELTNLRIFCYCLIKKGNQYQQSYNQGYNQNQGYNSNQFRYVASNAAPVQPVSNSPPNHFTKLATGQHTSPSTVQNTGADTQPLGEIDAL